MRPKLEEFVPDILLDKSDGLREFLNALDELIQDILTDIEDLPEIIRMAPRSSILGLLLSSHLVDDLISADTTDSARFLVVNFLKTVGSIDSIGALLRQNGYNGFDEELYPYTIELNSNGTLNNSRLSGRIYSRGSIRVHIYNVTDTDLRRLQSLVEKYKPTGKKLWWQYYFTNEFTEITKELSHNIISNWITYTTEKPASGIFELNRSTIGGEDVLTWDVSKTLNLSVFANSVITTYDYTGHPHSVDTVMRIRESAFEMNNSRLNMDYLAGSLPYLEVQWFSAYYTELQPFIFDQTALDSGYLPKDSPISDIQVYSGVFTLGKSVLNGNDYIGRVP